MHFYFDITTDPLDVPGLLSRIKSTRSGGVVTFMGRIRDHDEQKKVDHLFYEAHPQLARNIAGRILEESVARFHLEGALAVHRVGKVLPGELAVVVITWSAHRKEAYEANEHIIHRIKHEVPIWKKEVFEDGDHTWGKKCKC